jgi:hypothetical protein
LPRRAIRSWSSSAANDATELDLVARDVEPGLRDVFGATQSAIAG